MESAFPAWAGSGPTSRTNYRSVAPLTNDYAYWKEQVKSSVRVRYENDPAGQRGVVQRVEVQPGDNNVFGSQKGERAEVTAHGALGGFLDKQTVVISWSTFIDSGFSSPETKWNNFVQIHSSGGLAFSPWELNLVGDEAKLAMRLFGGGNWSSSQRPAGAVQEWLPLGSLSQNHWHDFVIEVRFGCSGNGSAKVWRDGTKVVDAQNRKIGYCDDPGMYWKQGFYRSAHDKTTRLWFDDTLRWANASDAFAYYGWSAPYSKTAGG
ncbi:MAG: polysaccharide lyase [Mycobacterium sp.]|nr:polysaccharide lyase [Mycobacterium sp.]